MHTITETKNTVEGINSRLNDREEQISDPQDKSENHQGGTEKRIKRNEDNLRDLWDNIKPTNICIIGLPEGGERERERGREHI